MDQLQAFSAEALILAKNPPYYETVNVPAVSHHSHTALDVRWSFECICPSGLDQHLILSYGGLEAAAFSNIRWRESPSFPTSIAVASHNKRFPIAFALKTSQVNNWPKVSTLVFMEIKGRIKHSWCTCGMCWIKSEHRSQHRSERFKLPYLRIPTRRIGIAMFKNPTKRLMRR